MTLPRPCLVASRARSLGAADIRAAAGFRGPRLGMTPVCKGMFNSLRHHPTSHAPALAPVT